MIIKVCCYCGEEFESPNSKRKCCNRECANNYRRLTRERVIRNR